MGSSAVTVTNAEFRAVGLDTVRRSMQTLSRLAKDTNRDMVASATSSAAAQRTAVQAVERAAAQTEQRLGRLGMGARGLASGLETMARSGQASGEALKHVVAQGADMAFLFGGAGPIIGAIGILGVAIYNLFDRARKEMVATRTKFVQELEQMGRAGDLGAATQKQGQLFSGDQYALRHPDESDAEFIARRGGLQGVRARIEELKRSLPARFQPGGTGFSYLGSTDTDVAKQAQELHDLLGILGRLKTEYAGVTAVVDKLTQKEAEQAAVRLQLAREQASEKGALAGGTPMDEGFVSRLQSALPVLGQIGDASKSMAQQLNDQMSVLFREYYATTTTAERRLAIEKDLADLLKQQSDLAPRVIVPIPKLDGIVDGIDRHKPEWVDAMVETGKQLGASVAQGLQSTLVSGIQAGMQQLVAGGGIGGAFKAFGGAILSGLGQIFVMIGERALAGLAIMAKVKHAIQAFLPEVGIPLAIGLIAFGTALQAVGGGMGGGGGSGGRGYGGGGYGSSLPEIIDRGVIAAPTGAVARASAVAPRAGDTFHFTILGPNDPQLHRDLAKTVELAKGRGFTF